VKKQFWLMMLLAVVTIFNNLGGIPLLDPDEPVYAETPREMIVFGDYVSPRIYGDYWYDKPPMYYWLVAGSFKLLGMNEFTARFPAAFLAVVCVAMVYRSMSRFFSRRSGVISGLVLATSIEYFYLGKAAVTDSTLTVFFTMALLFFLEQKYYLFYFFCALATVTKGPIGILLPGLIICIWLLVTRQFNRIKTMKIPGGVILFLLVAGPWYWAMYHIHGSAFLDGFIGLNNITRFTSPEHGKNLGWYYFIPVLLIGFFPWTALLGQTVRKALAAKTKEEVFQLRFIMIWAMIIFIFFSISSTKLISYILPMYPPLSMLVGWYLDTECYSGNATGIRLVWPILLTLLTCTLAGVLLLESVSLTEIRIALYILAGVTIAIPTAVWFFLMKGQVSRAVWSKAILMAVFSIVLVTLVLPPMADQFSCRTTAQEFLNRYEGTSDIYVSKFLHPGFTFYTGIYGQELKTGSDFTQAITQSSKAYFIVRESDYLALSEQQRRDLMVLSEVDQKVILKK